MKRLHTRTLICLITLAGIFGIATAAPPAGWRQSRDGSHFVEVTVDHTVFHSGKASASIRATQPEVAAAGACRQWIRAYRYREKRIRLSAYLRTNEVGPTRRTGARLELLVLGKTHRFGGAALRGRLIQGTTDWMRYEHVVEVPREAVALVVAVVLTGPGQVWVDDVKLEVVGGHVPTTASADTGSELSEEMKQRVQERLRTAPRHPVNLGFEQ